MLCYTNVVDQEIQKNEDHVHDPLKEWLRAAISFNSVQGTIGPIELTDTSFQKAVRTTNCD